MNLLRSGVQIHCLEQTLVVRVLRESAVFFLKDPGIVALHGMTVGIVLPVLVHSIDKEQRKYLDPLRGQSLLLLQMLLDRAMNHLPLHSQRLHIAVGLADAQILFATGEAKLQKLVPLGHPDLADPAIVVDRTPARHFQIVTILDDDFLPNHSPRNLHVQLDLGRDSATFTADR